jgi:general nucleoside transport system ATP-binding protein
VTAGEVLGIAGVDGNGQQELAEVLSGERSVESGSLEINGRQMTNVGARALIDAGVGVTTAERIAVGCVPGTSLATNLALKHISSPPFAEGFRLHHFEIRQFARDLIARFDIQPGNPEQPITELSGGNIQRALLGRELAFRPDLLVCHQPTAGLDVFTAEQMLARIHEAAGEGAAVLLISPDLDELLRHCDRIAVIYRGTIAGILTRAGFDPDHIARLMVTGQVEAA